MEIEGDFQDFGREALPLDGINRAMKKVRKQTENPLDNGDSTMGAARKHPLGIL